MAKYVAAYLSRVYGLCRVWCVIFNRNIVHLLVLINNIYATSLCILLVYVVNLLLQMHGMNNKIFTIPLVHVALCTVLQ